MTLNILPDTPVENHKPTFLRNSTPASTKPAKPPYRASKRASSSTATTHGYNHATHSAGIDRRRKRVRKACERCRMKRTKCDGNFPCKRCKDDGLVCSTSVRRKGEYKQLPPGYAEVLENTQVVLIATVHKLYSMLRNNQPWRLGEPELNGQGQPVVHNIAQKLDCIRPNNDIDLPLRSVFPEDEAGMAMLAFRLEEQRKKKEAQKEVKDIVSSVCNRTERASTSEQDQSDFGCEHQKVAFGNNAMSPSARSFTGSSSDFTFDPPPSEIGVSTMFPVQSASTPNFPPWPVATKPQPSDLTPQFLQQLGMTGRTDMPSQDLVDSEFGDLLASCHHSGPQIIVGMGDPMIYSSYDGEPLWDWL